MSAKPVRVRVRACLTAVVELGANGGAAPVDPTPEEAAEYACENVRQSLYALESDPLGGDVVEVCELVVKTGEEAPEPGSWAWAERWLKEGEPVRLRTWEDGSAHVCPDGEGYVRRSGGEEAIVERDWSPTPGEEASL